MVYFLWLVTFQPQQLAEFINRRTAGRVCVFLNLLFCVFIRKDGGFGVLLLFFDHVRNLSGIIFGNKVAIKVIFKCRDMEMRDTS